VIVNLFDDNFKHSFYTSSFRTPKSLTFVRDKLNFPGITVFTDMYLFSKYWPLKTYNTYKKEKKRNDIKCSKKVAWLIEPKERRPQLYKNIFRIQHKFDLVLTWDQETYDKLTCEKALLLFYSCWIKDISLHKKSKLVSMIYSSKRETSCHKLRHIIADKYKKKIDLYGESIRPIKNKEEGLNDYCFSVVVENNYCLNGFTEKIIDCLVTGTVPIYYGCPNIEDYFDIKGIFAFSNMSELEIILTNLSTKKYSELSTAIESNFNIAQKYLMPEDKLYEILNAKKW
jgi:hypothetical protein